MKLTRFVGLLDLSCFLIGRTYSNCSENEETLGENASGIVLVFVHAATYELEMPMVKHVYVKIHILVFLKSSKQESLYFPFEGLANRELRSRLNN